MYKEIKKDCSGYIVVETVGAFVPFMLLVVSILSLVNIITAQVHIHYALTQTAGTLSMYSYVLEAAGVSDELMAMGKIAQGFSDNIDGVLEGINALSGGGSGAAGINRMFDSAQEMAGDPAQMARGLANYGLSGLKDAASAGIAGPMLSRYLTGGIISAGEYFKRLRITDFEFDDCSIIDGDGNVKLTVQYEIEYTFGALRLPFTPTLRISQTAVTKAWLGGSGERYAG